MANRYWVDTTAGSTASWDANAGSKWSTTSGGPGGASVPTSADDVFFDINSNTGGSISISTGSCRNLTFTSDFSRTITSGFVNVYGDVVRDCLHNIPISLSFRALGCSLESNGNTWNTLTTTPGFECNFIDTVRMGTLSCQGSASFAGDVYANQITIYDGGADQVVDCGFGNWYAIHYDVSHDLGTFDPGLATWNVVSASDPKSWSSVDLLGSDFTSPHIRYIGRSGGLLFIRSSGTSYNTTISRLSMANPASVVITSLGSADPVVISQLDVVGGSSLETMGLFCSQYAESDNVVVVTSPSTIAWCALMNIEFQGTYTTSNCINLGGVTGLTINEPVITPLDVPYKQGFQAIEQGIGL